MLTLGWFIIVTIHCSYPAVPCTMWNVHRAFSVLAYSRAESNGQLHHARITSLVDAHWYKHATLLTIVQWGVIGLSSAVSQGDWSPKIVLSSHLVADKGAARGHAFLRGIYGRWASGRGSSEKVGRWTHAKRRGLGRGLTHSHVGGPEVLPPIKFLENIGTNLCNLVHFGVKNMHFKHKQLTANAIGPHRKN